MGSFFGIVRALCFGLLVSTTVANNTCRNPKVRCEWRKLSPQQRGEWIEAVNCLAALPHDPRVTPSVPANASLIPPINKTSSFYDDLVYLHMDLNTHIHFTGMFLPWHRYFVQYFENALTEKCGYKGTQPYWDWTQDAHDFYNANIFDNSSSGVGGWGDPANDFQITTGGFKDMLVAYPSPHHIRRNFSLYPFQNGNTRPPFTDLSVPLPTDLMINTSMTAQNLNFSLNSFAGDFIGFQSYMESAQGLHPGAHLIVSGDMAGFCPNGGPPDCIPGQKWSPNDPLFFLHHGMIDKIWHDWQKKSPMNKYSYGGGSVVPYSNFTTFLNFPTGLPPYLNLDTEIPGDGLWDGVRVWDMIDTTGDTLCYTYAS